MRKRLVRPLRRRHYPGLWRAGCCLLTNAARTHARIYPSVKRSNSDTSAAGRSIGGRVRSAEPTSLYSGPPGEKVAGMAHARIVLKRSKRNAHRPRRVHKRTVEPAAVITKPTENDGPAPKP